LHARKDKIHLFAIYGTKNSSAAHLNVHSHKKNWDSFKRFSLNLILLVLIIYMQIQFVKTKTTKQQ